MTVRVKVSHMDEESAWDLVITSTFATMSDTISLIQPGGSKEFFVHSSKDVIIKEITNQRDKKSGEAEASPS